MITWKIKSRYHGMRISSYLRAIHSFSNSILKAIKFEGGQILVNNEQQNVRYQLKTDDILSVLFPPEKRGHYMTPENIPLVVVYEDDDLLIINKPAGIVTMPNPHIPSGTIANGVLAYYDSQELPYTAHIVTRLDKNTSGLLLIAKHRYMHSLLSLIQQQGKIYREYRAIIKGKVKQKDAIIKKPIGRKPGSIIERMVLKSGKQAITHYEVLKEGPTYSLVKVVLKTGRTHQIRVHFASIGHQVLGDDLYGNRSHIINRQALHCHKLEFTHPITKDLITKTCQMPSDMRSLV